MTAALNLAEKRLLEKFKADKTGENAAFAQQACLLMSEGIDKLTANGVSYKTVLCSLAALFVNQCIDIGEPPTMVFSMLYKLDQAAREEARGKDS